MVGIVSVYYFKELRSHQAKAPGQSGGSSLIDCLRALQGVWEVSFCLLIVFVMLFLVRVERGRQVPLERLLPAAVPKCGRTSTDGLCQDILWYLRGTGGLEVVSKT